jgi:hypothetical protein
MKNLLLTDLARRTTQLEHVEVNEYFESGDYYIELRVPDRPLPYTKAVRMITTAECFEDKIKEIEFLLKKMGLHNDEPN